MRRRPSSRGIGIAAVLAAAIAVAATLWPRGYDPPSRIVLIVADTLRRDHLAPYDASRKTPHIAELAARGQLLSNFFASFHQTSMSMGALFTGHTPSIESGDPELPLEWNGSTWCGMARFAAPDSPDDGSCLPSTLTTLGEGMREAGYWTIGVASNHFLFDPAGFSRGFDDWTEVGEPLEGIGFKGNNPRLRSWKRVDEAVEAALARRRGDDFFLYVHYMDVHDYGGEPSMYSRGVTRVDHAIGLLLQRLGDEGLMDDCVVILTADHGERLGDLHQLSGRPGHLGNPSFQEVLELPLVIAPPIIQDTERFLRSQDLYDLLLEIAGRQYQRAQELAPVELLIGERAFRTYVRGNWKAVMPRGSGGIYLFDLDEDPLERKNVAREHPEASRAAMRRVAVLTEKLGTAGQARGKFTPRDEERLRALGYLE